MEWLLELLKKAGIEDTKAGEIVGDINKELPKHFVSKSQYNDVSEAKRKAEETLGERDKQLETLSKDAGASEELKEQIKQLREDNKAAKEKYESEAKELRINTAIKLALAGQVHDEEYAIGQLDKSKIEFNEDGTIKSGLEDQVKALRESKAFLFVQEEKQAAFKGFKPFDGKDKGSDGAGSLGASFAKQANESSKAPENNHWG